MMRPLASHSCISGWTLRSKSVRAHRAHSPSIDYREDDTRPWLISVVTSSWPNQVDKFRFDLDELLHCRTSRRGSMRGGDLGAFRRRYYLRYSDSHYTRIGCRIILSMCMFPLGLFQWDALAERCTILIFDCHWSHFMSTVRIEIESHTDLFISTVSIGHGTLRGIRWFNIMSHVPRGG